MSVCTADVKTEQRRNEQASLGEYLSDVVVMNLISFVLLYLDRVMQRRKMVSDFKAVKTQPLGPGQNPFSPSFSRNFQPFLAGVSVHPVSSLLAEAYSVAKG